MLKVKENNAINNTRMADVKKAHFKRWVARKHRPPRILDYEMLIFYSKKIREFSPLPDGRILTDEELAHIGTGSRRRHLTTPRFMVMWVAHYLLDIPFKEIGERYGNRTHSTVHKDCTRLEGWYDTDKAFREKFDQILVALQ